MTFEDIWNIISPIGLVGLIVILGKLIKVKPLEINFWQWLARSVGNSLNHDVMNKIKDLENNQKSLTEKLDSHVAEEEEARALAARKYILNFGKEIICGERHTREEFVEVLSCIDSYESYCEEHPKFANNRCVLAV